MKKIVIMTDSTCDLSKEVLNERKIELIKLHVYVGDQDATNFTADELFAEVDKTGVFPKTAAVNQYEFEERFKSFNEDDSVIYISAGANFSGTYFNSVSVATKFPNVHIIDSKNLSLGIGILVLYACRLRDEGIDALEIVNNITQLIPNIRCRIMIDSLEHLRRGGRCSEATKIIGDIFKIKPMIQIKTGQIQIKSVVFGFKRAIIALAKDLLKNAERIIHSTIMIVANNCEAEIVDLKKKIADKIDISLVQIYEPGPVTSTHTGPRGVGLFYLVGSK